MAMNAAQRIGQQLDLMNSFQVEVIRKWINTELSQKFIITGLRRVQVSQNDKAIKGYSKSIIMAVLRAEGFLVEHKCDDRPCAIPYFEIRIPDEG